MEYKKITNLPDRTSDNVPRFITKKQVEVYDQSRGSHNIYRQIRFKTSVLRSDDICNYSDVYIVIKRTITVTDPNDAYGKKLAFTNNAPFIGCISKINNTLTDNVEDLDIVMSIYNPIDHSINYSKTTRSL